MRLLFVSWGIILSLLFVSPQLSTAFASSLRLHSEKGRLWVEIPLSSGASFVTYFEESTKSLILEVPSSQTTLRKLKNVTSRNPLLRKIQIRKIVAYGQSYYRFYFSFQSLEVEYFLSLKADRLIFLFWNRHSKAFDLKQAVLPQVKVKEKSQSKRTSLLSAATLQTELLHLQANFFGKSLNENPAVNLNFAFHRLSTPSFSIELPELTSLPQKTEDFSFLEKDKAKKQALFQSKFLAELEQDIKESENSDKQAEGLRLAQTSKEIDLIRTEQLKFLYIHSKASLSEEFDEKVSLKRHSPLSFFSEKKESSIQGKVSRMLKPTFFTTQTKELLALHKKVALNMLTLNKHVLDVKQKQQTKRLSKLARLKVEKAKEEEARLTRLKAEKARQEEARLARLKVKKEKEEEARLTRLKVERAKEEEARLTRLKVERAKQEEARLARLKVKKAKEEEARLTRLKAKQEKDQFARLKAEKARQEEARLARLKVKKAKEEEARLTRLKVERAKQEETRLARLKVEKTKQEKTRLTHLKVKKEKRLQLKKAKEIKLKLALERKMESKAREKIFEETQKKKALKEEEQACFNELSVLLEGQRELLSRFDAHPLMKARNQAGFSKRVSWKAAFANIKLSSQKVGQKFLRLRLPSWRSFRRLSSYWGRANQRGLRSKYKKLYWTLRFLLAKGELSLAKAEAQPKKQSQLRGASGPPPTLLDIFEEILPLSKDKKR